MMQVLHPCHKICPLPYTLDVLKQLCGSVEYIPKIPEKSGNSNILPKGRKNVDMSKVEKLLKTFMH